MIGFALLLTVLRGLRSRALLSAGSLVLIALAVGATVLGPMFQEASIRSYTVTRVQDAPAPQTALSWQARPKRSERPLAEVVAAATAQVRAVSPAPYTAPEVTYLSGPLVRLPDRAVVRLAARDDACSILEVEGRCPERAGEVLVNAADLFTQQIGDPIELPVIGEQVIVGVYQTPTTTDDWLLPGRLASSPQTQSSPYRAAPYLVTPEVFDGLPAPIQVALLDTRLSLATDVTDDEFDNLVDDVETLTTARFALEGGGVLVGDSEVNSLRDVLDDVRAQRAAARTAVAPAVVSLILVALAMILRLLGAAAELRVPELALASLRGVGQRRSWVLGLSEPWLLVLLGTPLGGVAGWLAARALARSGLRQGIALPVPLSSVVGALLVAVAIAGVAVLAVWQVQRETLGARLTGVRRPGHASRGGLLVELVLVVLAAALLVSRVLAGSTAGTTGSGLGVTDLLLPVVVAVAAGLLVTRATTAATAWWTRRGTGGPISLFVATRAISRRTQGTLVMLPVTAAIAVSVFAVGVDGVARDWRASVAATETPADVVYASPLTAQETLDLSRSVDPEGWSVMAAARVNLPGGPVVALDATRLGRVGSWSEQWLDGRTATQAADLLVPAGTPPVLTGRSVSLTLTNETREATDLTVQLDVRVPGVGDDRIYVGPFPAGTTTAQTQVPECTAGCELHGLAVGGTVGSGIALHGRVVLADLSVDEEGMAAGLATATWLVGNPRQAAGTSDTVPVVTGLMEDGGLALDVDTGTGTGVAELTSTATIGPVAVIVGRDAGETITAADGVPSINATGVLLPVEVAGRSESTPLIGPRGVLVDLPALLDRTDLSPALIEPYLFVRADAPAAVTGALSDAGLTVFARADDTRTELEGSAYAQALRLYRAVAAAILLMALGGLLVSAATQLPARRRDAASLRVVGVPRRTIGLAAFWESAVVLVAAGVAGLGAGLLAETLLLRSLTLGVTDDPTVPRVVAAVDVPLVAVFALAVGLVLLAVSVATSVAVVTQARAATLRESAR